jgi:sugar fermentation stimulation protein A
MAKVTDITSGIFLERPNRFLGIVEVEDKPVEVFIPNPGRMYELLTPRRKVYLRKREGSHRKTSFDMIGVKYAGVMVSLDANLPNRFIKKVLLNRELEWFKDYHKVKPEPRAYDGRFDFELEGDLGRTFIEIKSCTLVENGRAIFPDAPTERGARHLRHLAVSLEDGTAQRAVVMFVIQRPDAKVFSPNDPTDPKFAEALRKAHAKGVEIIPIVTKVVDWELELISCVPYELNHFK